MTASKSKTVVPEKLLRNAVEGYVTSALFWELKKNPDYAFFTLSERAFRGLVPFKEVYLKYTVDDPTEYTFAIAVFGSWEHWQRIQKNKVFVQYLEKCREERDIAIESKAISEIMKEAEDGKNKFQAAKFLATKGYTKYTTKERQKSNAQKAEETILDDYKRLMNTT